MQGKSTGRFAPFTDAELVELWDGLTTDDGIRYGSPPSAEQVARVLGRELYDEATRRGLVGTDEDRWADPGR